MSGMWRAEVCEVKLPGLVGNAGAAKPQAIAVSDGRRPPMEDFSEWSRGVSGDWARLSGL
jgi:hypothetical protein